ncbi:MAG TPA: hypothetical protein ENF93_01345 [Ignisphaera sp.]|nr:hypothetical protein [Ignisphaera sp.]
MKYITRISADLIVLSSSSSEVLPPHFIGKTAEKILSKVHVPALVYTPLSRGPPKELESILLVISSLTPVKQALSLALSLAHRRGIKVSILSLVRLNSIDIELSKTYTWTFDVKIDIEPLQLDAESIVEEILKFAKESDLVVLDRHVPHKVESIWKKIFPFHRLSTLERTLLSISPTPILLV